MRKSALMSVCARRLDIPEGRVRHLTTRATDAGLLPRAQGGAIPPMSPEDAATFLIAVLADRGLGNVPATVKEFSELSCGTETLHSALTAIFAGGDPTLAAASGLLVLRLDPASAALTAGGHHRRYGPEPDDKSAGKTVFVPGQVLAAIALEFCGRSTDEADQLVALAQLSATISGAAYERKYIEY